MAAYYLVALTQQAWAGLDAEGREALALPGAAQAGLEPGDRLLAYLPELARWVGALEAETPAAGESVAVRPLIALAPAYGVPVHDLGPELAVLHNLANPNAWPAALQDSVRPLAEADGQAVEAALREAQAFPVARAGATPAAAGAPAGDGEPDQAAGLAEPAGELDDTPSEHTEIQWLLLKLGSELGLQLWVPPNDRSKTYRGQFLDSIRGVCARLPDQFDSRTGAKIQYIDVLWLRNDAVIAAFEIENSTAIHSGLLRLNDLVARQPHLNIPLFVVAPERRKHKVLQEIQRPSFEEQRTPLRRICRYISFERLKEKRRQLLAVLESLRPLHPDFLQQIAVSADPEEDGPEAG